MKRQRLTPSEREAILLAQGGTCVVEGCKSTGPFHEEHTIPFWFTGEKPKTLMCIPHHKEKTRADLAQIAKTKRQAGVTGQRARRLKRKAEGAPLLRSRGFDRRFKRKLNGKVVKR